MQEMVLINSRPQDAYRKQDVLTASSIDLVVMLYDALKKNLVLGRRSIEKNNPSSSHKHLIKAQEIVSALINSLDMNYQIADELFALYEFILTNTIEANIRKDATLLPPLIEMVDELRSAWYEISIQTKGTMHLKEEQA